MSISVACTKLLKIYICEKNIKTIFSKYEQNCLSVYDYYIHKKNLPNKFLAIDRTENGIDACSLLTTNMSMNAT